MNPGQNEKVDAPSIWLIAWLTGWSVWRDFNSLFVSSIFCSFPEHFGTRWTWCCYSLLLLDCYGPACKIGNYDGQCSTIRSRSSQGSRLGSGWFCCRRRINVSLNFFNQLFQWMMLLQGKIFFSNTKWHCPHYDIINIIFIMEVGNFLSCFWIFSSLDMFNQIYIIMY